MTWREPRPIPLPNGSRWSTKSTRRGLRESNALDFDDLLLEAVRLLAHDAPTRERLNRRYEFVMVDEYQDTNRSQYELMRLLTEQRRNICVVGDEDQSIYGWRGANIRNILDFERDFPGATIIRLEQNYRSTKNILEAANARWWPITPSGSENRCGLNRDAGKRSSLYEAPDSENEALYIADTIENRLAQESEAIAWRFCIAPTLNRGRLKKRCGGTGGSTWWWADSVFISARK